MKKHVNPRRLAAFYILILITACVLLFPACHKAAKSEPRPLGLSWGELQKELSEATKDVPQGNILARNQAVDIYVKGITGRYVDWGGVIYEIHSNGDISVDVDQVKEGLIFKTMEPEFSLSPSLGRDLLRLSKGDAIHFRGIPVFTRRTSVLDGAVSYSISVKEIE
jgi:hypothetical protein